MASRWRAKGMFKRKGSNNWQASFTIPTDIWNQRERLHELGVELHGTQQISFSMKTPDKNEAERLISEKTIEFISFWENCRIRLKNGPIGLNHQQIVALLGEEAVKFVRLHEGEPGNLRQPVEVLRFALVLQL